MRVGYFIGAIKIRQLKFIMTVAGPSSQRTIFKASSWFHIMIGAAHLIKRNLQPEGPFEANTSHPILLIGNTAGVY